ncbi:MAG: 2Fe-2S iron-sulfur cluster-binding protein [Thermodesulfobacteriota bacterium]
MSDLVCTIDRNQIKVGEGTTILQAAEKNGIRIPTLCYSPELKPIGVCRVCLVEVEGSRTLVAACHTPVTMGMIVHTRSPKVLETRKTIIELLLTAHNGSCVTDPHAGQCLLHQLASEMEVSPPRFEVSEPRYYPPEEGNPYLRRDLSKCILCRRCVGACDEIAGKRVLSVACRGFQSKIVIDLNGPLKKEVCKDCGLCIRYCPTGALSAV